MGQQVENFSLPDGYGQIQTLAQYEGKLVVLAFLGADCPLAKNYALRLRDLAEEFEPQGVVFLGIDSNVQDSLTEVATYARIHGVKFPVLKDNNNVIADRLGAVRTPEVFLLDLERRVRYWGRIDDQYGFKTGAGYVKPKLTERYLADAIVAVLAGNEVSRPVVPAVGCFIGRVNKSAPQGDITYAKHIARIVQDRCLECHRTGEVAPFPLTTYDDMVAWSATIREVVNEGRMPPWFADPRYGHFSNDGRLSDADKRQLCAWIDNGCPQGDERDLPVPRQFVEGWRIGEPDQVIPMRSKPFTVPAEGLVEYQYYTVDPGWTTDKWIQAAEARPGNRAVVHHIRVDVAAETLSEGFTRDIVAYVPGSLPNIWPEGTAVYVPAHSKLCFELHYTSNGLAQDDCSMVGVRFADPATVKRMVHSRVVDNITFKIPPGDPNFEVKSDYLFRRDTRLLFLWPHMHLRGKSFRFEAAYPDGSSEILLDVPNYDFNWQLRYVFAEPKLMPKGSRLQCTAHYDNSPENLSNPDPTRYVTASEQTWDEMMQGNFSAIDPDQDAACIALVALSRGARPSAASSADVVRDVARLLELGAVSEPSAIDEAKALYQRLKAIHFEDRRADYAWALSLVNQRQFREAVPVLTRYLHLGGDVGAYGVKVYAQMALDDVGDALEQARTLADRYPTKSRPDPELDGKLRDAAHFLGALFAYLELAKADILPDQRNVEQRYAVDRLGRVYADEFTAGQLSARTRIEELRTARRAAGREAQYKAIEFAEVVPFPYARERDRILKLFAP